MPELPEVEVVRAGLAPAVTGARVAAVEVFDRRALRRHDHVAVDFEAALTGARVLAAVRRGKFLWLPLADASGSRAAEASGLDASRLDARASSARALVTHLGMSGQVLLRTPGHPGPEAPGTHLRVRLHIEHPTHGELLVDFDDQRMFGGMAIDRMVPTSDGAPAGYSGAVDGPWARSIPTQVAHIARDPLDPAFDDRAFAGVLARKRSEIKRVLLDQTVVSGIGNIYADESLWRVRMHPQQPAASLSGRRVGDLLVAVRAVLEQALAEGGTSFDEQYVNVNGASGYFAHSLNVYGQQGHPCPRCGTPIVREAFMNRSSHRCPRCQRLRAGVRR
ncbi:bifunctional DNA-formamidopyrimidine glycosylase/DNA-(apurinic or apyrimidinic site) lyase [Agromyces intestinalis]|uniref:Formamidopyrimidine-DNA glycosylase n=1 Tax=Agromyces intestinalis TaxID=2592652 RepID=A0A5C1YLL8_9MICO|nr:bifunctional DNA-formamidopyrimidine glycosylase/DNA-(apurinic or apyrimidinic site) lyase [Agromyces intestinalis]QEO15712.1 bifunctional DNA-formamidopyrimidine glycosylase/DNA-(apurinic or apyrimidinic site) lyase [Agromyces intestinalis]